MVLPREYIAEHCPIARALEIVGERWTLLILRDAFFGVRRFSDFQAHLDIPKAVLAQRLSLLVNEEVLARAPGGRGEYVLTAKGKELWPTAWALTVWGNDHYLDRSARRGYRHAGCDGIIADDRVCGACGQVPDVADLVVHPPRRTRKYSPSTNPVTEALRTPHRLLQPIRPVPAAARQ